MNRGVRERTEGSLAVWALNEGECWDWLMDEADLKAGLLMNVEEEEEGEEE